jgi:lipopolysaccharide/colanic/teichoic acid biosynthesis glycosyltransferase
VRARTASGVSLAERIFDLTIVLVLMPAIVLAGAVIALAIYLDSPGPVMYRSWRVGRDGLPFAMLKFRKMRREAPSHPVTLDDDERFTPIGRFLAATRLDELPQIFNVLRGEMRLVGPRPELECFVAEYGEQYAEILTVTPGITGAAQLQFVDERRLLGGPDPESAYRDHLLPAKIEIDLDYARTHSVAGDALILVRTLLLPLNLFGQRLRARPAMVRRCFPSAAAASLLTVAFVVATSHFG